jgi:hypothetical protein
MCKHCERIKLHPEDRPIVHAFMERTALRFTERARENAAANPFDTSVDPASINITADDLDMNVTANFKVWRRSGIGDCPVRQDDGTMISARGAIMKMLLDMHK